MSDQKDNAGPVNNQFDISISGFDHEPKSLNIPVLRELKDIRGMLHGTSSWSQGLSPYLHLLEVQNGSMCGLIYDLNLYILINN